MSRSERAVSTIADKLIGNRKILAVVFTLVTLLLAWSAMQIQLRPGFRKMIPTDHPYMQTMMSYMDVFSGANRILVSLEWTGDGDIYNKEFMGALQAATNDVFFIKGINRTTVKSLFTPDTIFIRVTEDGFRGAPVVPKEYSATAQQIDQVRKNVLHSGQVGILVANNHDAALIRGSLLSYDRDKKASEQRVNYWNIFHKLQEIRRTYEGEIVAIDKVQDALTHLPKKFETANVDADINSIQTALKEYSSTHQGKYAGKKIPTDKLATILKDNLENQSFVQHVLDTRYQNIQVDIIGFAMLLGFVIEGLLGVFAFFALAFAVTILLLYAYTRSWKITSTALAAAILPVFWLIGVLPLIGFGIDPMSILVPFLIFATGVSHAVQMTSTWKRQMVSGADSVSAAKRSFEKLFIPGSIALLTEAIGFAVIMLIQIPIVQELGITACIGVLLMIITNKLVLPIFLSWMSLSERTLARGEKQTSSAFWDKFQIFAQPRSAIVVLVAVAIIMAFATWKSRDLVIGATGSGSPDLRYDSTYNKDVRSITSLYSIGVNVLGVIVEAKDFKGSSCLHWPVVHLVDRFELYMEGVAGVQSVKSVSSVGKRIISAFNEGVPKWRALPRSQAGLTTAAKAFDPQLGFASTSCDAIRIMIFTKNHKGSTIAHVVGEVEAFMAKHEVKGVNMRLATGNMGVTAATNEAVEHAEARMLLYLFASLIVLVLITFRSVRALLCIMIPLTGVTIMGNALMVMLGIGLKVATLPVIALGVGVGIDYGIYLFERIQHNLKEEGLNFQESFRLAMHERGSPIAFTAVTMAVGVITWTMSALKYQADMGLLLAFLFLVNMIGALILLPALGAWFYRDTSQKNQPAKHT